MSCKLALWRKLFKWGVVFVENTRGQISPFFFELEMAPLDFISSQFWLNMISINLEIANSCSVVKYVLTCLRLDAFKFPSRSYKFVQTIARPFWVSPGLNQKEVKCSAFDMETVFHANKKKLVFKVKVVLLASFWMWGFLVLGGGLLRIKVLLTIVIFPLVCRIFFTILW